MHDMKDKECMRKHGRVADLQSSLELVDELQEISNRKYHGQNSNLSFYNLNSSST